jgi:putative ABC transport system substrate-binding protein
MFGMRRRKFMTLFGAAAVWPLAAHAQQPAKIRRIGYLDYGAGILPSGGFAPFHDTYRRRPFLEGLRERGWVEGQNVTIERRFAAGQANRLPALAAELVALNVDVMLAAATPAAKAAQNATSRIAIVMADPGDAVQLGLVASLARPGANITGVTSLAPELATKRLALLKEAFPKIARVAVLWNSAIPPAEVALSCPSSAWMTRISVPRSSRCVAKECSKRMERYACGENAPAVHWFTSVRWPGRRVRSLRHPALRLASPRGTRRAN